MTVQTTLRPQGPYSFRLSARRAGDATRRFRDGVLLSLVPGPGGPERTAAWQRPDGAMVLHAESEAGLRRLRFVLGLDDDHTSFVRRFRNDALLGRTIREFRGLRPVRVATVAQALLRALCGQLIQARRAREIERAIIGAVSPSVDGLCPPPTTEALGRLSPADLRKLGLHARRAATLVRVCRSLELERLHDLRTEAVAARLSRERGLGPWSVGLVCLEGLGRPERGLVGDLGLVKLYSALCGRWVEGEETAALLEPYGEWAGLASVYLLTGFRYGLVPLLHSAGGTRRSPAGHPRDGEDRGIAAVRAAERRLAYPGGGHRHGPAPRAGGGTG